MFRISWSDFDMGSQKVSYLIAGVITGIFILVFSYFIWMGDRMVAGVHIGNMAVGGMKRQEVQRILMKEFEPRLQKKVTLWYNNRNYSAVLGTIGISPDYTGSVEAAYRIGRKGNVFERFQQRLAAHHIGGKLPLKFKHNRNTLNSFYRLLATGIVIEPVRTVVTVDAEGNVNYSSSRKGKTIDRNELTGLLEKAFTNDQTKIAIPVKSVQPALTETDVLRWKLNKVLGIYSTRFNPALADRVHNLRVASNAINNAVIYPGQTFSFNTWVGPRLIKNGYREAPVVIAGELVPGIGGGVCQVSSTLYNAVLLANLRVIRRQNHSLPSAYIAMGRDATVVDNGYDFIFENNLNTPVLLVTSINSPYIQVAVLGEKTNWSEVILRTEVLKVFPLETEEVVDPLLLPEDRIKEQEGRQGYRVALWRIVRYPDGSERKYLENTSIYPPRPEKYKVGIKPEVETDPQPEPE